MSAAASYIVEISPTAADRTSVSGTASLAGSGVNAQFAAGSYVTRNYTVLSAAGGVTGTFDVLATSNLPAGIQASLSYTATDVLLHLTGVLGDLSSLNPNQQNVANALNVSFN